MRKHPISLNEILTVFQRGSMPPFKFVWRWRIASTTPRRSSWWFRMEKGPPTNRRQGLYAWQQSLPENGAKNIKTSKTPALTRSRQEWTKPAKAENQPAQILIGQVRWEVVLPAHSPALNLGKNLPIIRGMGSWNLRLKTSQKPTNTSAESIARLTI